MKHSSMRWILQETQLKLIYDCMECDNCFATVDLYLKQLNLYEVWLEEINVG
jgi:hypothetical protein